MNKNIIVTGGLGFIGSNLINLLLNKDFNIINIDKITYSSNFYNTKNFEKKRNYKLIKCDIGNKAKIRQILLMNLKILILNLKTQSLFIFQQMKFMEMFLQVDQKRIIHTIPVLHMQLVKPLLIT